MTNAREKIKPKAAQLARHVLQRCNDEREARPIKIFEEEILKAMQREFDNGFKVGKAVAGAVTKAANGQPRPTPREE